MSLGLIIDKAIDLGADLLLGDEDLDMNDDGNINAEDVE